MSVDPPRERDVVDASAVQDVVEGGRRREDRLRKPVISRPSTHDATPPLSYDPELERLEIELLLEGIYRQYGFDFRSYAYASIRRRLWRRMEAEGLKTISTLQDRVLHEPALMEQLLLDLSINVTAMFRDRKSTRLNSSHLVITYAVFCLKKKKHKQSKQTTM